MKDKIGKLNTCKIKYNKKHFICQKTVKNKSFTFLFCLSLFLHYLCKKVGFGSAIEKAKKTYFDCIRLMLKVNVWHETCFNKIQNKTKYNQQNN